MLLWRFGKVLLTEVTLTDGADNIRQVFVEKGHGRPFIPALGQLDLVGVQDGQKDHKEDTRTVVKETVKNVNGCFKGHHTHEHGEEA